MTSLNVATAPGWVDILADKFAIEIDEHRRVAVEAALRKYAESLGESCDSLKARASKGDVDSDLWGQILHLATNHETRFFRYVPIIDLITSLAKQHGRPRILSVGCSTGEEPYSIATALLRAGLLTFSVHGTDISANCIDVAKAGAYQPHPEIGDDVSVVNGAGLRCFHHWVRQYCSFEQHNIMSDRPVGFARPDIIVTQNMLIYYKVESRHEILSRLAQLLPVGGYLICGPAEDASWAASGLCRIQNPSASVFRKV